MNFTEITIGLLRLLENNHYSPQTIKFYRREWKKIQEFLFTNFHSEEYEIEKGLLYLEKQYGFITTHAQGTLPQQRIQLLRIVHMLEDFQLHGVLTKRYHDSKNPIKLCGKLEQTWLAYDQYLQTQELSRSTKNSYLRISQIFLDFLKQKEITEAAGINAELCFGYVRSLAGYGYKTIEQQICGIRHFLRFLTLKGLVIEDIASKISMPSISKTARIPSAWEGDELRKMLKAINRNEPIGKRDYAMILLACSLGMRAGDIKRLEFKSINWEEKTISFVQHKTHKPLTLPLPNCVGWAIIDYVKNGRPKCYETPRVFVKHMPPFDEIGDENHLGQIIVKYMRKAGISRRPLHSGFHSLRHSAASMLLEMGTPLPVISDILGHSDCDVTAIYLKTDLKKLAECVLEPEPFL
jgi:integrase/recombinase XerD